MALHRISTNLPKTATPFFKTPHSHSQDLHRIFAAAYTQGRPATGVGYRRSLPKHLGVKFVPQQEAWIIERFGKYNATLTPGLNLLIPFFDEIKYVQSLKEIASEVPEQSAITKDNVTLNIDGVLYFRVIDPYQASYGVEDPQFAITQLAQTTMRSELGKISLDEVFKERDTLNNMIVEAINNAAVVWGIQCLRYEIRDIQLPQKVKESMQMQVEAERRKRAAVLESEGERESQINRATGEANAILAKANARAEAIDRISTALNQSSGAQAASLSVAEQYIQAFGNLAKTSNTVVLPSNVGDVTSMVGQALAVYSSISKAQANTAQGSEDAVGAGVSSGDEKGPPGFSARKFDDVFDDDSFVNSPTRRRDYDV